MYGDINMKTSKRIYFTISICIITFIVFSVINSLFPIFRTHTPVLEFGENVWYFSDTENNLEIKLTSDGSFPYGVMFYNNKEYEIELLSKASSAYFFIKAKNDSDFYFWFVGDCKIKSNGDISIKNIECLESPFINFEKNRMILRKQGDS